MTVNALQLKRLWGLFSLKSEMTIQSLDQPEFVLLLMVKTLQIIPDVG